MDYRNSEMRIDQLIGYFNGRKINLIPPFQRGHVWKLIDRKRLLVNIVKGRPIPAIFLYKEADGSQFSYNILDGKQRLESLILFIGSDREDIHVVSVRDYFLEQKEKRQANFEINLDGENTTFKNLPDEIVREFREYAIPTIEIELDEDTSLDEIINLFVDINQQGERVKRFDIIKAIGQGNALLSSVFELVAQEQTRRNDKFFKKKNNSFTRVLERLQVVSKIEDRNQSVDRMWERLVEIVLFNRTGSHRQPGQVLKTFMPINAVNGKSTPLHSPDITAVTTQEIAKIKARFDFLDKAYKETTLGETRMARDLPHFYTLITVLLSSDLLEAHGAPPDYGNLRNKLVKFAAMLEQVVYEDKKISTAMEEYKRAAARQTTHPGRRRTRADQLLKVLESI